MQSREPSQSELLWPAFILALDIGPASVRGGAFARTRRWLSPGEFLFLRLFGEPRCSVSMASGTGMLNQSALDWDEELLSVLPIERDQLSSVVDLVPSRGLRDEFARRLPALAAVPWIPPVG